MAKRSQLMKIVAVSIVLLFLVSGFSVMVYGSGSEKSISPCDISGNSSTNKVIANISVGSGPVGVAYDSSNGYVYVTNKYSNNVSVINGATNKVIASIAVGSMPELLAYDPSNGYVYVANYYSNNVSIISASPKKVTTPTNYLLYIIIVIVVIIAVLGVVMAMRRGKNKGGPKQWQEPPKQQPPQQ